MHIFDFIDENTVYMNQNKNIKFIFTVSFVRDDKFLDIAPPSFSIIGKRRRKSINVTFLG